jgi:hypothetical protein
MATKKSSPKKSKQVSEESNEPAVKAVGLFDHVNQIKGVQNPKYFDTLSEADKKSFSHVMILKFLSMDRANLDTLSYISKYQDTIPSKNFYTLLISAIPKTNQFHKYIKAGKNRFPDEFYQLLARWFECSSSEAEEYAEILIQTDAGLNEMINICKAYGLTEKEVEKLMDNEN